MFIMLLLKILREERLRIKGQFGDRNNNNNNIRLPNDKVLYDLDTFIFRNGSLYRYGSHHLILLHDDVFQTITRFGDDEDENSVVIVVNEHIENNNILEVDCEGKCECYSVVIDDEIRRRGVGSLVYSYRYLSVVVVSVFGLAVSKFVNDHIDECYDNAKRILDGGEYYNDERSIVCVMEEVECKSKSKSKEEEDKKKYHPNYSNSYECNGHCMTSKRIYTEQGNEAVKKLQCDKKYAREQPIEIYVKDTSNLKKMKAASMKERMLYSARYKYRKWFLEPFCRAVRTSYWLQRNNEPYGRTKYISPCIPYTAKMLKENDLANIECRKLDLRN